MSNNIFKTIQRLGVWVLLLTTSGVWGTASDSYAQESYALEWHIATQTGTIFKQFAASEIMPQECFSTGADGQAYLAGPASSQIRLREDTAIRRADINAWAIDKGLAGFRFETASHSAPLQILITPYARAECTEGIFIVKVVPFLVRIAVLRGTAQVSGVDGRRISLHAKQECAATESALSSQYETTDDLYYAWYWNETP